MVDVFSDWDRLGDDWSDLKQHYFDFYDGIEGVQQDLFDIGFTSGMASMDKFVSVLPVSDEFKSSFHDTSVWVSDWVDDFEIPTLTSTTNIWSWFND